MDCLFCRVANGELATEIIYENDTVLAFRDINPQAPTHVLVIPKKHIDSINHATADDTKLLGSMVLAGKHVAAQEGLHDNGYRLVFNINNHGGQTVYHIHLHVLGGRQMTWPPG
ncbi:MAG: histidine triad nucleotide-binding protein [Legionellaceae bacterium]|nr:histidine triad nucleotide-binding protein [Legionellaceae bacterium]